MVKGLASVRSAMSWASARRVRSPETRTTWAWQLRATRQLFPRDVGKPEIAHHGVRKPRFGVEDPPATAGRLSRPEVHSGCSPLPAIAPMPHQTRSSSTSYMA
jgi:hypothetical protein